MYYSLNGITGTELTQIQQAFSDWTTADTTGGNDSGVTFAAADANHPAMWTWTNGSTPTGVGTQSTINSDPNTSRVISVTTTVGVDTLNADGSPLFSPIQLGFSTVFAKVGRHEVGHTLGLGDVTSGQVAGDTVMNQIHGTNDSQNFMPTAIQNCDNQTVNSAVAFNPPPASCPSTSCNSSDGTQIPDDCCQYPGSCCPGNWVDNGAGCCQGGGLSPIIVDVDRSGFHLTNAADGVLFDFFGIGKKIQLSWTAIGSTNAFLVLDRNNNGIIDSAKEMFGNITAQPQSATSNGFLALAEFDKPENGGNGDGIIDSRDAVFSRLRLWIDKNHNGISEPDELFTLPAFGISALDLKYEEKRWTDENGNQFRFRAKIDDSGARWAYDVFLVTARTTTSGCASRVPGEVTLKPRLLR